MLGSLARFAADRAIHGVTDSLVRRAMWYGAAALLLIFGLVFLAILSYLLLEPLIGPLWAAAAIAAVCFVVAGFCLMAPSLIEKAEAQAKQSPDTLSEAVSAVKEEAREAVDYIGPMRLVGSAFMVGIGVGRRVGRSRVAG